MKLLLNDQSFETNLPCSLSELLFKAGYQLEQTFAVAVNQTFVPRSEYFNHMLYPNDRIEVVAPMQGG